MNTRKKLIACILAVAIMALSSAFATASVDESAIAEKVLTDVTTLYEDFYTISDAKAEIQGMTTDNTGNTIVTIVASFNRTLKATCAEDIPYIQGLESALAELTDINAISVARAYIDAKKADLEDNYIGVPQDTFLELQVTIPTGATRSMAANNIGLDNVEYIGMFRNVPAEELAPASTQDMIESGQTAVQTLTKSSTARSVNTISISDRIKSYNRTLARDYARTWSCTGGYLNDHKSCHNPDYKFYDSNDCTNFVSQCLAYGGLEPDDDWKPYTDPWTTTGNLGNGIRQYVTNNGLFFHSTSETKAFAGSIINWLNDNGTNAGHVGLVDQNDTITMTFCAHTRCRKSCPWTGEKVDFYIPYWDSYANDWTQQ